MMTDITVTAIGADRPGIVAEVTGTLFERGCNLADCSMTLLGGQFAVIMLIEAPEDLDASDLERSLHARSSDLVFSVRRVAHIDRQEPTRPFVLSLYGRDRPGMVHKVADTLAGLGINITDLVSRAAGEVYVIVMDLSLPEGTAEDAVLEALSSTARQIGVDLTLRPADASEL